MALLRVTACLALAVLSFPVDASLISWQLTAGPRNTTDGNAVESAKLTVHFDSDDVLVSYVKQDFSLVQWGILGFDLVLDGETILPGVPRNPGGPVGTIGFEQRPAENGHDARFEGLSFDFDLEGGGILYWSLYSQTEEGAPPLSSYFGFQDPLIPIGAIEHGIFGNTFQGYRPDGRPFIGRVDRWVSVSEPSGWGFLILGLLGRVLFRGNVDRIAVPADRSGSGGP